MADNLRMPYDGNGWWVPAVSVAVSQIGPLGTASPWIVLIISSYLLIRLRPAAACCTWSAVACTMHTLPFGLQHHGPAGASGRVRAGYTMNATQHTRCGQRLEPANSIIELAEPWHKTGGCNTKRLGADLQLPRYLSGLILGTRRRLLQPPHEVCARAAIVQGSSLSLLTRKPPQAVQNLPQRNFRVN